MAAKVTSPSARRSLKSLGANLKIARRKRRIALEDFAERIGVSESAPIRLEKGDEGVSIGALTMACLALGELGRISEFLDPGSDDTGLLMDQEALPRSERLPRPDTGAQPIDDRYIFRHLMTQ